MAGKTYYRAKLGHIASIKQDYVDKDVSKIVRYNWKITAFGVRPDDSEVAKRMHWIGWRGLATARRKMGDFFGIQGGVPIATAAMKEVFSELNLGGVEFLPIQLFDQDLTEAEDGEYYLFFVPALKNVIDIERSKGMKLIDETAIWWQFSGEEAEQEPVVKADVAGELDVFLDPQVPRNLFISEDFKAALKDPRVTVRRPTTWKCRTF